MNTSQRTLHVAVEPESINKVRRGIKRHGDLANLLEIGTCRGAIVSSVDVSAAFLLALDGGVCYVEML